MLYCNCSPSFNWKKNLDESTIAKFQRELGAMGTSTSSSRWLVSTALTTTMFNLAHGYARNNMSAFVELQEAEFAAAEKGFTAVKHQREVGTGYFDAVTQVIQGGKARPLRCMVRRRRTVLRRQEAGASLAWDKTTSESLGQND